MQTKERKAIYTIAECAVFIALAVAASFVEIKIGALGGSIDFVMVPLFIIGYRHGAKYSYASCFAFAVLYCVVGGKFGYGLPSVLLDYLLAYTMCGTMGIFKGKSTFIEVGVLLSCLGRFAIAFISGITLYAITAPTEIGGIVTSNAWLYSLIYNGLYMLPNTVIAVVAMSLLRYPLKRFQKSRI